MKLPCDWLITELGYVWPGSYVDINAVESIFKSWKSYLYHISSKKENELVEFLSSASRILLSDAEVRGHAKSLCLSRFGHEHLRILSLKSRKEIALELVRDSGVSQKQINRILNLQ